MSVDKIRALLELMKNNELVELKLSEGDFKVVLRKPGAFNSQVVANYQSLPITGQGGIALSSKDIEQNNIKVVQETNKNKNDSDKLDNVKIIKSPIVGTFYRSPSPEAQPFVSEGSKVSKDTVVCIIEAMKIMNEVKADIAGQVVEVLVENGEPVEYDQPLFAIKQ